MSNNNPCVCFFFQPTVNNAWESLSCSPVLLSENGIVVNLSGI